MKETKRFLVYYNESRELIGMREHHFDWEEGDVITTNGVSTVIFGIFEGTEKNRGLVGWLFKTLKSFLSRKKVEKIVSPDDFEYDDYLIEEEIENLKQERKSFIDAKRRVWKSFDAELDFIDAVFAKMDC